MVWHRGILTLVLCFHISGECYAKPGPFSLLLSPPCLQINNVEAQLISVPVASGPGKGYDFTALIAGLSAAGGGMLLGIMVGLVWYRRKRAVPTSGFCCCVPQMGAGGMLSQSGQAGAFHRQASDRGAEVNLRRNSS